MKKLYMGSYIESEGEVWLMFVSDGTRKPLLDEFADVVDHEHGVRPKMESIREVAAISEIYDYTTKEVYKVSLRKKTR